MILDKYHVPLRRVELDLLGHPECGIAVALYVSGCPRRCEDCQNSELQVPKYDDVEGLYTLGNRLLKEYKWAEAITYLGGDWMMYKEQYVVQATVARGWGMENVLYTGELFEDLPEEVVEPSDWIIDGPYDKEQKGVYPASTNQRVFHNGEQVDPTTLPLYKRLAGKE